MNTPNLPVAFPLVISVVTHNEPGLKQRDRQAAARLDPLETEVIDYFVPLSRLSGQPAPTMDGSSIRIAP